MGKAACWSVFILGIAYLITTLFGLLSIQSPQDPISDPFFSMMEILTILIAPSMAVSLVAVHDYAALADKKYSLVALFFMFIMTGITSCVHFVILSTGQQIEAAQIAGSSYFFSFKWPSVVYALDILAWDWFFALSMLFAAPVFKAGRLAKMVRTLMIVSGALSLAGLIGVPLENMQVRNIGIIGYAVIAPVIFLLIGILLGRTKQAATGFG